MKSIALKKIWLLNWFKIKKISLTEKDLIEAYHYYQNQRSPRNSIFDYYSYIAARNNNYSLLTSDWKLKKELNDIDVYGPIWYVDNLYNKGIISKNKLINIYTSWLEDPQVYISSTILKEHINKLIERD